jgi:hypothetical protein
MVRSALVLGACALVAGGAIGFALGRASRSEVSLAAERANRAEAASGRQSAPGPREGAAEDGSIPPAPPSGREVEPRLPPTAERTREQATEPPTDPLSALADALEADTELARRLRELQGENARLRSAVKPDELERQMLDRLFEDAKPPRYADLYRAVFEITMHPEVIAADPRVVFPIVLRALDETGFAAIAPDEWGKREIELPGARESGTLEATFNATEDFGIHPHRGSRIACSVGYASVQIGVPEQPMAWLGAHEWTSQVGLEVRISRHSAAGWEFEIGIEPWWLAPYRDCRQPFAIGIDDETGGYWRSRDPYWVEEDRKPVTGSELAPLLSELELFYERLARRLR